MLSWLHSSKILLEKFLNAKFGPKNKNCLSCGIRIKSMHSFWLTRNQSNRTNLLSALVFTTEAIYFFFSYEVISPLPYLVFFSCDQWMELFLMNNMYPTNRKSTINQILSRKIFFISFSWFNYCSFWLEPRSVCE